MCGIAAGIKAGGDIESAIAKILTIAQDVRGGDGGGFFYKSSKGFKKVKGFPRIRPGLQTFRTFVDRTPGICTARDLFINRLPSLDLENLFIGHARKLTTGTLSYDNTHPIKAFKNGNIELVHNGTAWNYKDIAKKHNLGHCSFDSKLFAKAVEKGVETKVFGEYKGSAACVWHDKAMPQSLFFFRGKSSSNQVQKPLFMLKTEDSLYLSSIESSLKTIQDLVGGGEISSVPQNKIYKATVKNGVLEVVIMHTITRAVETPVVGFKSPKKLSRALKTFYDEKPSNKGLRCCHGMYYYNGKLLSSNMQVVQNQRYVDPTFIHDKGILVFKSGKGWKDSGGAFYKEGVKEYWFYKGIMLRNKLCFEEWYDTNATSTLVLSKYAKYPIWTRALDSDRERNSCVVFLDTNSKPASGDVTFPFGDRSYLFLNGFLQSSEKASKRKRKKILSAQKKPSKVYSANIEERELNLLVNLKVALAAREVSAEKQYFTFAAKVARKAGEYVEEHIKEYESRFFLTQREKNKSRQKN